MDGLRLAAAVEAESDMPATGACATEMRERAQIWQELTEIERRFVVEDAVALYLAWRRREIERLDRMIEAGAMDALDDQIDAHRKERGRRARRPGRSNRQAGFWRRRPPVNGQGEQWDASGVRLYGGTIGVGEHSADDQGVRRAASQGLWRGRAFAAVGAGGGGAVGGGGEWATGENVGDPAGGIGRGSAEIWVVWLLATCCVRGLIVGSG